MAPCQRPFWTTCFLLTWALLLTGLILTHVAVASLAPVIGDLVPNVIKGFDETFQFAHLNSVSSKVTDAASQAVKKCGVDASIRCSNFGPTTTFVGFAPSRLVDTSVQRDTISTQFGTTLSIVRKVAHDKYFGIDDLKQTAQRLDDMKTNLDSMQDTMTCRESSVSFCAVYTAAAGLVENIDTVNKAIDTFRKSPIVEQQETFKQYVSLVHLLPYPLVLGMLFLTCFWLRGGICCCCEGGTMLGCLLVPFALLWLVSFTVSYIVFLVGSVFVWGQDYIPLIFLKGEPTMAQLVKHIQTEYPEFWTLVFQPFESSGPLLHSASGFFVAVCLCSLFYSYGLCCCRPYSAHMAKLGKDEEQARQLGKSNSRC